MAALGLGGYTTSESDEEGSFPESRPEQDSLVVPTPAAGGFAAFGNSKGRVRTRKGGLPLFNRPLSGDSSDSDDEEFKRKRKNAKAATDGGPLGFLPPPEHDFVIRESEASDMATTAAEPAVQESAEQFRVEDAAALPAPAVAVQPPQTTAAPLRGAEALLAKAGNFNVQFKEISADALQAVAPHQRAEMEAVRTALGSEHAKQLQAATAGKEEPTKRQKQRHQINSLYHQARVTELQDMEKKLQGGKSKAETAAKYGW